MSLLVDIASWALMLAGGVLVVGSGIGLVRLSNLFARLHAGGLADTGGAALLLLGMGLQAGWSLITVKLLLIAAFLFFTAPTASHALAHAAILGGLSPDGRDENADDENADEEDD